MPWNWATVPTAIPKTSRAASIVPTERTRDRGQAISTAAATAPEIHNAAAGPAGSGDPNDPNREPRSTSISASTAVVIRPRTGLTTRCDRVNESQSAAVARTAAPVAVTGSAIDVTPNMATATKRQIMTGSPTQTRWTRCDIDGRRRRFIMFGLTGDRCG